MKDAASHQYPQKKLAGGKAHPGRVDHFDLSVLSPKVADHLSRRDHILAVVRKPFGIHRVDPQLDDRPVKLIRVPRTADHVSKGDRQALKKLIGGFFIVEALGVTEFRSPETAEENGLNGHVLVPFFQKSQHSRFEHSDLTGSGDRSFGENADGVSVAKTLLGRTDHLHDRTRVSGFKEDRVGHFCGPGSEQFRNIGLVRHKTDISAKAFLVAINENGIQERSVIRDEKEPPLLRHFFGVDDAGTVYGREETAHNRFHQ